MLISSNVYYEYKTTAAVMHFAASAATQWGFFIAAPYRMCLKKSILRDI